MTVYPAIAYPALDVPGDYFRVRFSGIACRTPIRINRRQKLMIRMLGNVMRATHEQLRSEMFESRINPFMAAAYKRLPVVIGVGDAIYRLKKTTRADGRFEESILIPSSIIESAEGATSPDTNKGGTRTINFDVLSSDHESTFGKGKIFLMPRHGVSVISDIDDTIKDSKVGDRRELLANTFLREFRSVDGMADVYRNWESLGASFHYVSSSPWQLYEALKAINTDLGFPDGSMHLRNFRLRDQILNRFIIRKNEKASEILKLVQAMPEREFILIGDSGEKDPRIYRKICKRFPNQVRGVFIRSVAHRPFEDKQSDKLAKSLPNGVVASFSSASELEKTASELLADL